jgi:hypothetical protein
MSDLQPYLGGYPPLSRDSKRAARAISRYQGNTQVRIAGTDHETDVSIAKVDSITAITGQAMTAVTRVAQAQKHLEMMAPEVSGRLGLLADGHAISMVEIMTDHQRVMRRR